MSVSINTAARNALVDSLANIFAGGTLRIRSGSMPSVDAAPTGTLLAEIPLPTPAFQTASNGEADKDGTWIDTNLNASGQAGYYRITNAAETITLQGDVGLSGSGASLELDDVALLLQGTLTITAYALAMPSSL